MTRQEYQFMIDTIKSINIANDLFDVLTDTLKNPEEYYTKVDASTSKEKVTALKEKIIRTSENIMNYINMVKITLNSSFSSSVISGLEAQGFSMTEINNDIKRFEAVSTAIKNNALSLSEEKSLQDVSVYIDSNIPKLQLVRKIK